MDLQIQIWWVRLPKQIMNTDIQGQSRHISYISKPVWQQRDIQMAHAWDTQYTHSSFCTPAD